MGRIIDRRRVMGGGKLPYDAEIEYLQSTGTQWIDTLVNQKETQRYLSVEVIIKVPFLGSGEYDIAGSGSGNTPTMGYYDAGYFTWAKSDTFWSPKTYNTSWHDNIYTFYTRIGRTFSEDGVIYQNNYSNNFTGGAYNTLFLFASSPNRFPLKCQIKYVKIIIDDVVRFDAIPVRVGTTGYLYDKVSKQLFGNAGTGDFILGKDKGFQNYTEIEYLESNGTQFIDTLHVLKENDVVECVVCNTTSDFEENKGWGTGNYDTSHYDLNGGLRYVSGQIAYWYWGANYSFSPNLIHTTPYNYYHEEVHFSAPQGYVQLEDLTTGQIYNITGIALSTFPAFSVNIFKANGKFPHWGKKRFKYFRITNNNILILDLIPVRIGNVGYMYDKVSGRFFGNSGTGNFILGPDK